MKIILIFLFSVFVANGQSVRGTILDEESNKPLENVNVYFKKQDKGTVSNDKGNFILNLESRANPSDILNFSIIGYESEIYELAELKTRDFVVLMRKKVENLDEVAIRTSRELKSKLSYNKLSSMEKGLHSFGSALVDGNIYVLGGDNSYIEDSAKQILDQVSNNPESTLMDFIKKSRINSTWEYYSDKFQTYNIETDSWTTASMKLVKRAYHKVSFFQDEIYIYGGKTLSTNRMREYLSDKIEVITIDNNKIAIDNTNPHQAVNFAAFNYKDNIIMMGGSIKEKSSGKKVFTEQSHIYNVTSGYWYELPKMTKAKEVNGILIENKIYLIGGFNNVSLKEIESYDLKSGDWKKEGDLFYGMSNPSLTHNADVIYIFNDGNILTYNLGAKALVEYETGLDLKQTQIFFYDEKLYLVGGYEEDEYTTDPSKNVYSIDVSEFSKTKAVNSKLFD